MSTECHMIISFLLVKYICIHTCIHFSNIRKVDALKTIKTTFERDLAEVKIKAISQETRTPILSGPRAKKKVLCSDLLFETRIFFPPDISSNGLTTSTSGLIDYSF